MRFSIDTIIRCPFFQQLDKNLLCCEGFVDNTCMTTKFPDRDSTLRHIAYNCTELDGGRCPLAKNLFEKYRLIEQQQRLTELEWYEKLHKPARHKLFVPEQINRTQRENRQP